MPNLVRQKSFPGSKQSNNSFTDVDSFHELLHLVDVDNIADAAEVYTLSVFSIDLCPEVERIKYLLNFGNVPHIHTVNNPRTEST
jgi:hypothetical protein